MKKLITMMLVLFFALPIAASADDCLTPDQEAFKISIQDRLQEGFRHYNGGWLEWLEWCDTLYDEDFVAYNIYGERFTLEMYKRLMGAMMKEFDIVLGGDDPDAISVVLIDPTYDISYEGETRPVAKAAIQYDVMFTKKPKEGLGFFAALFSKIKPPTKIQTMEFVDFVDDGDNGARVLQGWALSSGEVQPSMDTIMHYMDDSIPLEDLIAEAEAEAEE